MAGFAVSLPRLRTLGRPPAAAVWPALSAGAAFAVFAAPVLLSGRSTFTGYSMITDIAHHFDLAAQLQAVGPRPLEAIDSSFAESLRKLFGANYPLGMHSVLAGWSLTSI